VNTKNYATLSYALLFPTEIQVLSSAPSSQTLSMYVLLLV